MEDVSEAFKLTLRAMVSCTMVSILAQVTLAIILYVTTVFQLSRLVTGTATIYVDNGLDQAVVIQVKANRERTYANSVNVGSPFTVAAGSQDARTLTPSTSGWLPYVTVEVYCTVAPTSGSLTVYLIRGRYDQAKLVDALEIRDTLKHNPTTDPDKIFIREW